MALTEKETALCSVAACAARGDLKALEGAYARAYGEGWTTRELKEVASQLYYYANSDREVAANRMEIDFLLEKPTLTRRHNIRPVEVKSGRSYSYTSLDKFCRKFSQMLDKPYILHVNELGESPEGVIQLPLYMTQLLVMANT